MDVLLRVLYLAFFAPLVVRIALRRRAGDALLADVRAGLGRWQLVLHGAGLVLLWVATWRALGEGAVARAPTVHGGLGALVVVTGVGLMAWATVRLSTWRLTPEVREGHQLTTTGPYAIVRHPMYCALDLLAAGSAAWTGSALVAAAAVLVIAGGDLRARAEERALLARFGDAYAAHMARVRRFVPGLY